MVYKLIFNDAMWKWYQSTNISRFGVNVVDDHFYFWTIMNDNTAYDITLFYNNSGIAFSKYDLNTGTNTSFFSIKGN